MKSQFSKHQKHNVAESIANLISQSTALCRTWQDRRQLGFCKYRLTKRTDRALREIAFHGEANAIEMRKSALAASAAFRGKKYDACFAGLTRCGDALIFNAAADVVVAKLLEKPGQGIE